MPPTILLVLLLLVAAVLAFAIFIFGMKYLFDYRVTERGLYLVLARLVPLKLLPIRKIASVERGPFDRWFWRWGIFTNVRLGNRLHGELVWVKTRGLPMTGVIVTPEDPDAFERDLRHAIEARDRASTG